MATTLEMVELELAEELVEYALRLEECEARMTAIHSNMAHRYIGYVRATVRDGGMAEAVSARMVLTWLEALEELLGRYGTCEECGEPGTAGRPVWPTLVSPWDDTVVHCHRDCGARAADALVR